MLKQSFYYFLLALVLVSLSSSVFAQLRINSPYSRFGIGELSSTTAARYSSMGNLRYSLPTDNSINRANAASYSSVDSGSFVFDAGFRGLMVENQMTGASSGSNYFNLDYLKAAFPVTNWWRSSIGLMPYSMVGYEANTTGAIDSVGNIDYAYLGDGGVNQLYFGNAFKITSELSVGFNAAYLFGDINARRSTSFPDISGAYEYRIVNSDHLNGAYLDFGVQYHKTFLRKNSAFEGKTLSLGLTIAPQQKLGFSRSSLAYTFTTNDLGVESVKDTLKDNEIADGKVTMPLMIGGGFSYGKKGKWLVGLDGTYTAWKDFRIQDINDSLQNSLQLNVGGEYYLGRVALRVGGRYEQGNLDFNGTRIDDLGISFGVGIPLRQYALLRTSSIANLNLGVEAGQRGTMDNGLVKQQYVKFYMSIGIQNKWFQKIKYQ